MNNKMIKNIQTSYRINIIQKNNKILTYMIKKNIMII